MLRTFCWLILLSAVAGAQTAPELLERKLLDDIEAIDRATPGVLGVAVIDLTTGHAIEYHGTTSLATASSIKVAILAQMFLDAQAGKLKWDETVTLTPQDTVGGSGYLQKVLRNRNYTLSWREMAAAMIEESDNLATNQCIQKVGMERVTTLMASKGLASIRLQRKMLDTDAARAGRENVGSPRDLARLMQAVWDGSLVGAAASKDMIEVLKNVDADMRKSIPGAVPVAAKPGELDGIRCEIGLVLLEGRPFALAVMGGYLEGGADPVPAVTRLVYGYFERVAHSNGTGRRLD